MIRGPRSHARQRHAPAPTRARGTVTARSRRSRPSSPRPTNPPSPPLAELAWACWDGVPRRPRISAEN
eukprot:3090342-Lingulodinium_polyedra.AAC.1